MVRGDRNQTTSTSIEKSPNTPKSLIATVMNAHVHYLSKSFGARYGSPAYVAKLSPHSSGGEISLFVGFPEPVHGLADSSESRAEVTGFSLSLSKEEAVELATAILTFACHPSEAGKERKWMSLSSMPELDPKQFRKKIILTPRSEGWESYDVTNKSDYHIAAVTVEFSCMKVGNTSRFKVTRILNLPPGEICVMSLSDNDFPDRDSNTEVMGQRIVSITGFHVRSTGSGGIFCPEGYE